MPLKVTVVGVHPVEEAPEPCHLIELAVEGVGTFDIGAVTQPDGVIPEASWQAPYDEHSLAADGSAVTPLEPGAPFEVRGPVRVAFFMHHLVLGAPLHTPVGSVPLPAVSARPRRLQFMKYEPPC